MRVIVLNGPNLDLLGTREPQVYGSTTLAELEGEITRWGKAMGIDVESRQSNDEGELIHLIHQAEGSDGLIVNPGAFTHTSRAMADAVASVGVTTVEVHISNIWEREPWRRLSVFDGVVARRIYGRGITGYRDALRHLINAEAATVDTVRYGPHPDNVGDLRTPQEPRGLVVLVHGGFWRREWERDTMESLAVDLHARGLVTWNLEYRRLGGSGGWPGSAHDVLMALEYTPQLSDLAAGAVAVIGHSAGGHLALWSVDRVRSRPVDLIVGLAPITDLGQLAAGQGVGSREGQALLEAGAPATLQPPRTRGLLVHGARDEVVPVDHSTRLAEAVEVEVLEEDGHFDLLDPSKPGWAEVVVHRIQALFG